MDAAKKSFQLQAQVRHNAEEFKNTMNELYMWQKEIKDMEQELQSTSAKQLQAELAPPVRSHSVKESAKKLADKTAAAATAQPKEKISKVESPTEKVEMPIDANEEKRKQANIIKERGNQQVKLGDFNKALEEYSAAIDIFPEDAVFYSNRALCYLKLKKYYDCIEDCERAIEIDKQAVKAYYRRMQANQFLGNDFHALEDCTKILMIDPKNGEARKSLQVINETLRDNFKSISGPNFSDVRSDMCFIQPIQKAPHERSKKPLHRVAITDVVGPKDSKNHENSNIQVSDEVIDKLFNSDCGPFVEVKKPDKASQDKPKNTSPSKTTSITKTVENTAANTTKATTNTAAKTTTKATSNTAANTAIKPTANTGTTTTTKESSANNNNKQTSAKQTAAVNTIEKTENKAEAKKLQQTAANKTSKEDKIDSNKIPNVVKENPVPAPIKKTELSKTTANLERPLPTAPTSTAQFYSNWKELSPAQKYQYLKSIDVARLCRILGAGFDSDTLTDVINTMRDFYVTNKEANLAATMLEVSKNNQVAILSLLMSNDDRKAISEILNSIKENKAHAAIAAVISKNFNLK